jgi:hypothetical protein
MACKRLFNALRVSLDNSINPRGSTNTMIPRARNFPQARPGTPRATNRSTDRTVRALTESSPDDESAVNTDAESVIELTDDEQSVVQDFHHAGE